MVNGLMRGDHPRGVPDRFAGVQVARVAGEHLAGDDHAEPMPFLHLMSRVPKLYGGLIRLARLKRRGLLPTAQIAGANLARKPYDPHLAFLIDVDHSGEKVGVLCARREVKVKIDRPADFYGIVHWRRFVDEPVILVRLDLHDGRASRQKVEETLDLFKLFWDLGAGRIIGVAIRFLLSGRRCDQFADARGAVRGPLGTQVERHLPRAWIRPILKLAPLI